MSDHSDRCPECGYLVREDETLCPNCGAMLDREELPGEHSLYFDQPKAAPEENASRQIGDAYPKDADGMPNRVLYLFLVVITFMFAGIFGILAIPSYVRMCSAISDEDAVSARAKAKQIRMFFFIGLGVNVLFFIITVMLAMNK